MHKVTVSIIIVYFRGWKDFEKCLKSIRSQKSNYRFETIIVNNGKESIKKKVTRILPRVVYIQNQFNNGYGAGNNLGSEKAQGEFLFILNPDVELQKNTINTLVRFLKSHAKVAVAAPNLLYPDHTLYTLVGSRELTPLAGIFSHSFIHALFPKNPIAKKHFMLDIPVTKIRKAFAVPGCAFMIRKNIFEKVGKFDEQFFLYYEESDLGKRLQKIGQSEYIIPDATVVHNHSFDNDPMLKKYNIKSRFLYFKKHYGWGSAFLVEACCRFSKKKAILATVIVVIVLLSLSIL